MFSRRKSPSSENLAKAADTLLLQGLGAQGLSPARLAEALGSEPESLPTDARGGEQICLRLLQTLTRDLHAAMETVIRAGGDPLAALTTGLQRLSELQVAYPGAHLLLLGGARGWPDSVVTAARHLVSAQRAFVAELLRQANTAGKLAPDLDVEQAAGALIALLHGAAAHARLFARTVDLDGPVAGLLRAWTRDPASNPHPPADCAPSDIGPGPAAAPPGVTPPSNAQALQVLDVRPTIARGEDPLQSILSTLDPLGPGGVLKLTSPFRPAPLLALLEGRGHAVSSEQIGAGEWSTEIIHSGQPQVEDLRDLEPPEPLERVLERATALQPGDVYLARLPRYPRLLIGQLAERGVDWQVHQESDGSALLRLWRPR